MRCDTCDAEATFHEVVMVGGRRSDKNLCESCAGEAAKVVERFPEQHAHFAAHFAEYMRTQEAMVDFLRPPPQRRVETPQSLWDVTRDPTPRIEVPRVEILPFDGSWLARIGRDPSRLAGLGPGQFQRVIAECFRGMGFEVLETGHLNAKDGGIDIIAKPKHLAGGFGALVAVQCEHHRDGARTGRGKVSDLLRWKGSAFQLGVLVTNTDFTTHARFEARQPHHSGFLRLRGFDHVAQWIQGHYVASVDWTELPNELELAPGISVDLTRFAMAARTSPGPHRQEGNWKL